MDRGLTWTISRGCTDSVGKFPRPWIGTLSPRIESKRRTWSQDSTLTLRLWSEELPEDMTTGLDRASTKRVGCRETRRKRNPPFQNDETTADNTERVSSSGTKFQKRPGWCGFFCRIPDISKAETSSPPLALSLSVCTYSVLRLKAPLDSHRVFTKRGLTGAFLLAGQRFVNTATYRELQSSSTHAHPQAYARTCARTQAQTYKHTHTHFTCARWQIQGL